MYCEIYPLLEGNIEELYFNIPLVRMIYCVRIRTIRDLRSNIPLCPKEFRRAKSEGTPEGKGVYLTVYPKSSPNTDSISF